MQTAPDPDEDLISDSAQGGSTDPAEQPIRGAVNNPIFVPTRPPQSDQNDTPESFSA